MLGTIPAYEDDSWPEMRITPPSNRWPPILNAFPLKLGASALHLFCFAAKLARIEFKAVRTPAKFKLNADGSLAIALPHTQTLALSLIAPSTAIATLVELDVLGAAGSILSLLLFRAISPAVPPKIAIVLRLLHEPALIFSL